MKKISLLAGLACLAFAGSAVARGPLHTLIVQLPDGSVEQIRYTGDVAPTVVYQPQPAAEASPFAVLDRLEAAMDAQMNAEMAGMMREAAALAEAPLAPAMALTPAALGSGADVCIRSVRVVFDGGRPQVTESTAGSCAAPSREAPVFAPAAVPHRSLGMVLVRNATPRTMEVASR